MEFHYSSEDRVAYLGTSISLQPKAIWVWNDCKNPRESRGRHFAQWLKAWFQGMAKCAQNFRARCIFLTDFVPSFITWRTIAGNDSGVGSRCSRLAMFGLPDRSDDFHGGPNLQLALEGTNSECCGHGGMLPACHSGGCGRLLRSTCRGWCFGNLERI